MPCAINCCFNFHHFHPNATVSSSVISSQHGFCSCSGFSDTVACQVELPLCALKDARIIHSWIWLAKPFLLNSPVVKSDAYFLHLIGLTALWPFSTTKLHTLIPGLERLITDKPYRTGTIVQVRATSSSSTVVRTVDNACKRVVFWPSPTRIIIWSDETTAFTFTTSTGMRMQGPCQH